MKRLIFSAAFLLLASIYISGCSDSDNTQTPTNPTSSLNLVRIDSSYAVGAKAIVALYSTGQLMTGYNNIYVALYDSATGSPITDAHVSFMPMMDMGSMMHSSPYESPEGALIENKWFKGAVVFIMPSSAMTPWSLEVHVHNHQAAGMPEGHAEFGSLSVADNSTKYKSIQATDGSRLYLSYVMPSKPIVGINEFEFTLHRRNDMMTFPADSSYTCDMYPWMPSMGHSSPNNVNPVHDDMGHYKGQVNFTMTGDWQIKVYLNKNGQRDSTYFDLVF
ncbi:MAG: FixH family protein [Ignavibacteria bacterium]|nr:FixH family protein [Ignavibacteria bacterium]